jgi:hypothetical protein
VTFSTVPTRDGESATRQCTGDGAEVAALAPADDLGVRLEDGDQLLGSRYTLSLEDPPLCLGDHSNQKTRKVLYLLADGGGLLLATLR